MPDLSTACRKVQDALGVTDGGIAGVVLMDPEGDAENEGWSGLALYERRRRLANYVAAKMVFCLDGAETHEARGTTDKDPSPDGEAAFRAFQATRKEMRAKAFGELVATRCGRTIRTRGSLHTKTGGTFRPAMTGYTCWFLRT